MATMVEFRGQRLTERGATLEMASVLAKAKSDLMEVLDAFPEIVYGSGLLEQAIGLVGHVEMLLEASAEDES